MAKRLSSGARALLVVALMAVGGGAAQAADIAAQSQLTGVTVFPQGAQVSRMVEATLPAGEHVLVVDDLPASLQPASIRVEGKGAAAIQIGSVDARTLFVPLAGQAATDQQKQRKELEDQIERLTDEITQLEGLGKAIAAQARLVDGLANLPNRPAGQGVDDLSRTDWGALFNLIGEKMQSAQEREHTLALQRRTLDRKIADLRGALEALPPLERERTEVRIALLAEGEGPAQFTIQYQVADASWRPFYDARLTTGEDPAQTRIALARRAGITQSTGEDWQDATVTLSTARPAGGTAAPDLRPQLVMFRPKPEPRPVTRSAPMSRDFGGEAVGMAAEAEPEMAMAARPVMKVAREQQATVDLSAFNASFQVPGKVSVLSDGTEKKVRLSSDDISPELSLRATPKLDATAYLYAKFTVPGAVALLPGQVSLYRDGIFVGEGVVPLVNPGDTHELGFGADDAIKITHASLKRQQGETGLITASKTDERQFKIEIKNLRKAPVQISVRDQMPYSENEKIQVQLLPSSDQPTVTNLDDKRGVLAWDTKIAPGQSRVINFGYRIIWPKDEDIVIR